jgi:hypothetical protein
MKFHNLFCSPYTIEDEPWRQRWYLPPKH